MRNTKAVIAALAVVSGSLAAACGSRHASDVSAGAESRLIAYSCGERTYRLAATAIDGEVKRACETLKTSLAALAPYSAAEMLRTTCQHGDAHVIYSLRVPKYLYDDYEKSCRGYLAIESASPNDRDAKHAAFTKLNSDEQGLSRKFAADAAAGYRQKKADQGALEQLIKERGGSIEIGGNPSSGE